MLAVFSTSQWLRENIPWLFSGIGVSVVTLLAARLRQMRQPSASFIRIDSPRFGAHVKRDELITGLVQPPTATVVVIVHPMATDEYWPQHKVSVRNDGTWSVKVIIGAVDPTEKGGLFEIVAIADPLEDVTRVLNDWPQARARSDVLQVIRA